MSLLIQVLSTPQLLADLNANQWQLLISQSNISQLTGRINYLAQQNKIAIPEYVVWHLNSVEKIASKQRQQVIREFFEVSKSLNNIETKLIFLKGAAYIAKKLPCSYGRIFSDIDILVTRSALPLIERILKFSNWLPSELDDYDEKYYRTWMHEIPPLYHTTRGTVLDVHHNILPITNKHTLDANSFLQEIVVVEGVGEIRTLTDLDLCIHMVVHLFTESEFHHGLRDLSDFDLLLAHFQKMDANFVDGFIERAKMLGLYDYVRLALRYSLLVFERQQYKIKPDVLQCNSSLLGKFQDFCFLNIFKPNHSSCRDWKMTLAEFFLYWRGHLIRMPLRLLIPHLFKKLIMRFKDKFKKEELPDNFL
ncbi:MAG: nucleotidyltransferase family protein [Pseudomonadota bacterium]